MKAQEVDSSFTHTTSTTPTVPTTTTSVSQFAKTTATGCFFNPEAHTIVVSGSFKDDNRLDTVIEQSSFVVERAALRGNIISFAFLGGFAPALHHPSSKEGPGSRILQMATHGFKVCKEVSVKPANVILLSGKQDLAWLRLLNSDVKSREITRFDSEGANEVVWRYAPKLAGVDWDNHNDSLDELKSSLSASSEALSSDVLAVVMFLKLASIALLTMQEPSLISEFSQRIQKREPVDPLSFTTLDSLITSVNDPMKDGLERLLNGDELTPEGLALVPASKQLVDAILTHTEKVIGKYMLMSSIIRHCGDEGDDTLWLVPEGLSTRLIEGCLSSTGTDLSPDNPEQLKSWADKINTQFTEFVYNLTKGSNSSELYIAYLSMASSDQFEPLPIQGMHSNPFKTSRGVTMTDSRPFATVERRLLVEVNAPDEDDGSGLVEVLEEWANVNTASHPPSTFWCVASWCQGTKLELAYPRHITNKATSTRENLSNVSVTLESLLSAPVKGGILKDYDTKRLNGVIGPCITRHDQIMRLVYFKHHDIESYFVVLLPDEFVRFSLDYYDYDYRRLSYDSNPMLATEGFIALRDEHIVALKGEETAVQHEMQNRIWLVPKRRFFSESDYKALNAMRASNDDGKEVVVPGFTIFRTRQTSADSFAGLKIGLTHVPGMPGMTIDTDSNEYHALFRVCCDPDTH